MRTITAGILLLFIVESIQAQTKLYVLLAGAAGSICTLTDCEPGYVMEIDVDGGRVIGRTLIGHARAAAFGPAITADARYLVWTGEETISPSVRPYLSVFDTVTRTTTAAVPFENGRVFAHPTTIAVFAARAADLLRIEPTAVRIWPAGCEFPFLMGMSGDGARIFMRCYDGGPPLTNTAVVLNSETGATIHTLRDIYFDQVPNADGTEVYTADPTPFSSTLFTRYALSTGAILAQRSAAGESAGSL